MLFYSFDSDEENPLWPCSPRNLLPHVEPAPGEPSRPPPKGRLAQIAEAVRPGTRPPVPRRTGARARLRGRDAAVRASDSRRRLGGSGTFPPRKSLKTNETELEPRRNLPGSEDADPTSVSPDRKELRHRVSSRRRSREIGAAADARLRNFPIRNPLKRPETAKESRRPSLPAWARAP